MSKNLKQQEIKVLINGCSCCNVLKKSLLGLYPTDVQNLKIDVFNDRLFVHKEKLLKTEKISFKINYCPMCGRKLV